MDETQNLENVKSCIGCIYYYVTWEPKFPKGCKFFGIKSMKMPCQVVRDSTQQSCNMYTKKRGKI